MSLCIYYVTVQLCCTVYFSHFCYCFIVVGFFLTLRNYLHSFISLITFFPIFILVSFNSFFFSIQPLFEFFFHEDSVISLRFVLTPKYQIFVNSSCDQISLSPRPRPTPSATDMMIQTIRRLSMRTRTHTLFRCLSGIQQ